MPDVQVENGHTRIATELLEAICRIRIPGEASQVFFTILRKTYGFQKKHDRIPLSQFALATGISKPHVLRAIKTLEVMNMIAVKGNEDNKTYSIIKDYTKWIPLPKKATLPKKAMRRCQKRQCVVAELGTSIDNSSKDNSSKDKDIEPQNGAALTPQAQFVERFAKYYEAKTGAPYKADRKDFVLVAGLLKKFGMDVLVQKARILAQRCEKASEFYTKSGWEDFTIGTLSVHANKLLMNGKTEDKYGALFAEMEAEHGSIDEILDDGRKKEDRCSPGADAHP